jgi:hypothetical protein
MYLFYITCIASHPFFFVLVNPGSETLAPTFLEGNPESAAVYLDVRMPATPLDALLRKARSHELEIRKRGFSSQTLKVKVPRRIFATPHLSAQSETAYELSPESLRAIMVPSFKEFANWSFSGKPSANLSAAHGVVRGRQRTRIDTLYLTEARLRWPLLAAGLSVAENASSTRDVVYASARSLPWRQSPRAHRAGAQRRFSPWQLQKLCRTRRWRSSPKKRPKPTRATLSAIKQEASRQRVSRFHRSAFVCRSTLIHHVCRAER